MFFTDGSGGILTVSSRESRGGVARSSVWHLLLELQASALEFSGVFHVFFERKKRQTRQIPKIRKTFFKNFLQKLHVFFFTSLARHCILSSREFDPESRADVGGAQLVSGFPTLWIRWIMWIMWVIIDHRPSTVCFLLRSWCRMPVEPCVLGCIQLSHEKHALESTDEVSSLLYIYGPNFSKVQGEDPPVHPGYKKDGEGQLESPQFSVNIGLRGVEAIARSSLRCCSRCIEMWQFLLAEGRCMLMWHVVYSFCNMIRRMDKEMLFLCIHTK